MALLGHAWNLVNSVLSQSTLNNDDREGVTCHKNKSSLPHHFGSSISMTNSESLRQSRHTPKTAIDGLEGAKLLREGSSVRGRTRSQRSDHDPIGSPPQKIHSKTKAITKSQRAVRKVGRPSGHALGASKAVAPQSHVLTPLTSSIALTRKRRLSATTDSTNISEQSLKRARSKRSHSNGSRTSDIRKQGKDRRDPASRSRSRDADKENQPVVQIPRIQLSISSGAIRRSSLSSKSESSVLSELPKVLVPHNGPEQPKHIHLEQPKTKDNLLNTVTCHQCRIRRPKDAVVSCTRNSRANHAKPCALHFCRPCLATRYGLENLPEDHDTASEGFRCPPCHGNCNCTVHMKRAGLTHLLRYNSKCNSKGRDSVAALIGSAGNVAAYIRQCLSSSKGGLSAGQGGKSLTKPYQKCPFALDDAVSEASCEECSESTSDEETPFPATPDFEYDMAPTFCEADDTSVFDDVLIREDLCESKRPTMLTVDMLTSRNDDHLRRSLGQNAMGIDLLATPRARVVAFDVDDCMSQNGHLLLATPGDELHTMPIPPGPSLDSLDKHDTPAFLISPIEEKWGEMLETPSLLQMTVQPLLQRQISDAESLIVDELLV